MIAWVFFSLAITAALVALAAELTAHRVTALGLLAVSFACMSIGCALRQEAWGIVGGTAAAFVFALLAGLTYGRRLWPAPDDESED